MKEKLERINKNAYLVFVLMVFKIWDIVKPLFKTKGMKDMSLPEYYANYDWVGFTLLLIVISMLYWLIKAYVKIQLNYAQQSNTIDLQKKTVEQLNNSIIHLSDELNSSKYERQLKDNLISAIIQYNIKNKRIEDLPNAEIRALFSVEELKILGFNDDDINLVHPKKKV